jgi:hypothetical protein
MRQFIRPLSSSIDSLPQHPSARASALYAGPGSADFFLFKRVKEELAGKTLEATWEQVFQSIAL